VTIDALIEQTETVAARFHFVQAIIRLDRTRFSVKYRLVIRHDLWTQVYYNIPNDTVGMALIYQGRRLYGRDCEAGRWHRHPANAPECHDFSDAGSQPATVEDFLLEIGQILVDANLI